MGKTQTPEQKAAEAAKRAEKAAAKKAEEKAAEELAAKDKQQNAGSGSLEPPAGNSVKPQYEDPDAPGYVEQAEGTVRYPILDIIPIDFLPNTGTLVEGTAKWADGSEIEAGEYETTDGLLIVVQADGTVSINEKIIIPSGEDETKIVKKKIAVVIPYLKAAAQGKELLYAIRSLARNFSEDFDLVVIGDKEDWFSDEILYIEHACMSRNPQADVVDKIKQILIDERISDTFVWSNDDIYFVAPTTLEDIQKPKTDGELTFNPAEKGIYNSNRGETIKALQSKGYPVRNFSTHTPFLFEKEKMIQVFEAFPKVADGLLLSSVYFNMHVDESEPSDHIDGIRGPWLLRIISQLETEEKKKKFRELIPKKHFLNHSEAGYSALLMDWIGRQFPDKCRFEK